MSGETPSHNEENNKELKIDIEIINGKKYQKVDTGYTLREFFSHSTPEKGPGPGWDSRWGILEKYGVWEPSDLPDEPYFIYEEVK